MWLGDFICRYTASADIYTLSLHDALPISGTCASLEPLAASPNGKNAGSASGRVPVIFGFCAKRSRFMSSTVISNTSLRSEEHTSELQSRLHLVCRLLLEKKK